MENGVAHFADPKIAGCSGYQYPNSFSIWNEVRQALLTSLIRPGLQAEHGVSFLNSLGIFHTVSGAFRRNLWLKYPFDETFSIRFSGAEDKDWAFYFYNRGYKFVVDPKFSVYHSHHGSFQNTFLKELQYLIMYIGAYRRYQNNAKYQHHGIPSNLSLHEPYVNYPYQRSSAGWEPWMDKLLPFAEVLQRHSNPY